MGFGSDYMISSARKDRRAYKLARKYLLSFESAGVTPEILEKYLNFSKIDSESKTMAEIYKRLLISAQNANMKAGVIGGSIGGIDKLGVVLFEFDPVAVFYHYEDKWDNLLNEIIMRVKPRGSIRRTTRSIWPKYCQSVLSGAKFLSQFKTTNEFYEWVDFFDKENRARHALPMLISHEIYGFGFALACDFLKELGYINFGKPDGHIKTIFSGLGLCAKASGDYEVFKAIIRVASNVGVDAYNVDKLFWLAGSGYFYADTNLGKNGRISQISEAKFIEYARKLLAV